MISRREGLNTGTLSRRDFIRLGLSGAALAGLNRGCQEKSQPAPSDQAEGVYKLSDGKTLYDDFDGNGCLQTYDHQDLATAGQMNSFLWDTSEGADVVDSPVASGLLTTVNEHGERIEYRREPREVLETEFVYNFEGTLVRIVPHVPGMPYHGSKRLVWAGARDGEYDAQNGGLTINKGRIYGSAEAVPSEGRGWVVRLTSSLTHLMGCLLAYPRYLAFADFKSFSADIMMSSTSTARNFYTALDYHTTIPEQPPGKSWVSDIGLHRLPSGELCLFAQCWNVNEGRGGVYFRLGRAQFDTWYNVRQDIVTSRDDPALRDEELRIEYYVNGILMETEIPEDSELLLDPGRTGWGPNRLLINYLLEAGGEGISFFDNVKAVYRDRIG